MKRDNNRILHEYLRSMHVEVACMVFFALLAEAGTLAIPDLISRMIDTAAKGEGINPIWHWMIYIVVAVVAIGVCNLLSTYLGENMGWKIRNKLKIKLLEKCFKMDNQTIETLGKGAIYEYLDKDTEIIHGFYTDTVVTIASCIFSIVLVVIIVFRKNVMIGLFESAFILIAMIIFYYFKGRFFEIRALAREQQALLTNHEGDLLANKEDVKGNSAQAFILEDYKKRLNRLLPIMVKSEQTRWRTYIVSLALRTVGLGICLVLANYYLSSGVITIGQAYLFFQLTNYVVYPINLLQQYVKEKQRIDVSVNRLSAFLEMQEEYKTGQESSSSSYNVRFQDVSFKYNDNNTVLNHVILEIKEGEICGITGRTGCGKSTLTSLLLGFNHPDSVIVAMFILVTAN